MFRAFLFLLLGCGPLLLRAQSVGLVLSGGGASGLAHIGVMKALEENGVPIDYVAGSSIGALIGGLYAAGWSPQEIDSLFRSEAFQTMAEGGIEDRFVYAFQQDRPDASLINLRFDLDTTLQTSLPTNLRSPLLLDFEQMRGFAGATAMSGGDLDSLFVPFRCVASDITAQVPVTFDQGDLAQVVRASMSYPFYFKPIRVNGHLMMDGGLYNNFPSDVMYDAFLPDLIIGSNVGYNAPPPSEDDLLSQLRAMMQERTDYSVKCENGIVIEPQTLPTLFDFTQVDRIVQDGYDAAMARMPEILAATGRHVHQEDVHARRDRWRTGMPDFRVSEVTFHGLTRKQDVFADKVLGIRRGPLDGESLKSGYFRLAADNNISNLYPMATYRPDRGDYDLALAVKRQKDLEVRFGGMFSSRPVNTGMVGLQYNFFGRASHQVEATSYFGKFYAAGQVKLRSDLATRVPLFLEPTFVLHRWDHFRSFATFFDEVRPSYIVIRELWGGLNAGMAMGNKGVARMDLKYAQTKDQYYQNSTFTAVDTADVTEFYHVTGGLSVERSSLNRKQHPNAGELLRAEVRWVVGDERTIPGSTRNGPYAVYDARHEWFQAKVTLDKYFLPRGVFRFGLLAEGVFSTMPFFQNYTATVIRAPFFQPTPESRTLFINDFRAPQYLAGGVRTIAALFRNKFDLRLEGYVFQPYRAILQGPEGEPLEGEAVSDRSYIASGSLIYQSPIGPVWFNTSYIDGLNEPWIWSLNFGYVIFAQRAME
ncbi:MAG TPA: patatin-like phospholipase family protein [Flavobacteriales bacterium]|nr:patatin-like phospholipase family protein [Flavobacteriales bacterium]MCB9201051.1 patatin-like phospholipase family protein [Flavobacteriales bacterium]HOP44126.1 patatin-like phospholipase family protein [Flavobacteriales bacterium]